MNLPDAIIVGDIHARDSQPRCRLDDFWETQKSKFLWLRGLWEELGRPAVFQPGDVFHNWKSSPQVIRAVLEYLPSMVTVPGNPGKHNYQMFEKDSLSVVKQANVGWEVITTTGYAARSFKNIVVVGAMWGEIPEFIPEDDKFRVLIVHADIAQSKNPYGSELAMDYLRRVKGFDLVVTGHNHAPFMCEYKRRKLINPGSFTRQESDELHSPTIWLLYAKTGKLMPVAVPIQPAKDVITREHLTTKEQRDERITAFVESLAGKDGGVSIKFEDNVRQALAENNIRAAVRERVEEAIA